MPSSPTRTLLITGGAGFIGSNFVEIAVSLGHKVIVLDALTYAGHIENLETIKTKPGAWELTQGNICDVKIVSDILRKHQPDAIINFAAESHVDRSITGPGEFIETNIRGVFTLLSSSLDYWQKLEPTKMAGFRFIQVSTDEVYGSLGPTGKFSETTQYQPNSPYSASKAAGDHLARAWFHTYGLPTVTTNCTNNYGPKQFPEKLIPHMINCALTGKPLPVYGDGGNIRDWIHVQDHCAGVMLALAKGKPGETYFFGGYAEKNNLDVVRTICKLLDEMKPRGDGKSHSTAITFVQDRLGHDRRYAIDDTRAQRELGFKRNYRFETGLADTVRWYLDNKAWCEAVLRSGAGK